MIIDPIHFKLKDGRSAVLRNPAREDAEGVLRMFLTMLGETDFLLAYPEEKEKLTVEAEAEILDKINQSPDSLLLICEVEGVIAGDCDIRFNSRMK
ncbi:MAG: GNAT family N-acetyltransferase, partial [Lachnospiraceae bacterium]|nr:GNAT family N-acetyltransferase [Lachnospiraceae bacterium]